MVLAATTVAVGDEIIPFGAQLGHIWVLHISDFLADRRNNPSQIYRGPSPAGIGIQ